MLEDLIDEHGTAPEFLDRIETELDDADGRLHTVREEVAALEEHHEADVDEVHGELVRVDDDLARLDDGVDANAAAIAAVEEDVRSVETERSEVRDAVETVETELSTVREEVQTVQDEVDALDEFRDSLAAAVQSQDPPTPTDETQASSD